LEQRDSLGILRPVYFASKLLKSSQRNWPFRDYVVGDKILILDKKRKDGIGQLWKGPYRIVKVLGNGAYKIKSLDVRKVKSVESMERHEVLVKWRGGFELDAEWVDLENLNASDMLHKFRFGRGMENIHIGKRIENDKGAVPVVARSPKKKSNRVKEVLLDDESEVEDLSKYRDVKKVLFGVILSLC